MMKLTYLLAFLPLALTSCSNNQKANLTSQVPSLDKGCYVYHQNGDLVEFNVVSLGDTITGPLNYALFEKDKNSGTFSGVLKDSLLIGTYTFMSEGQNSSREMVFKVTGNQLIEGYGDINTIGNRVQYKNIQDLKFDSQIILEKGNCTL